MKKAVFWTVPLIALLLCEAVCAGGLTEILLISPIPLLLAAALLYLLFAVFLFLTGSFFAAAAVPFYACLLLAVVDRFKMLTLNEHLFPWDLYLAKNTGQLTGFVNGINLPFEIYAAAGAALLFPLLLFIRVRTRVGLRFRLPAAALCLAGFFALTVPAAREAVYPLAGLAPYADSVLPASRHYRENGLVTGFVMNLGADSLRGPSGDETGDAIAQKYPPTQGGEGRPDVIVLLCEAFWDPNLLKDISFSCDPMADYKYVTGGEANTVYSPVFGGGTVLSEWEVLSGSCSSIFPHGANPYQQYVKGEAYTFARYFKELGYETVGVHSNTGSFYSRDSVYSLLGFDAFYGLERFRTGWTKRGEYCSDDSFMDELIYELERGDSPKFIFGITMENHGPYTDRYSDKELLAKASGELPKTTLSAASNYATGAAYTAGALKKLFDYIQERERDTAVLFFGDHLPAVLGGFSFYRDGGLIASEAPEDWSLSEYASLYSTPYGIFTNYLPAYKSAGETLNAYALIPELCEFLDLPLTSQMRFALDQRELTPGVSYSRIILPNEAELGELYAAIIENNEYISRSVLQGVVISVASLR